MDQSLGRVLTFSHNTLPAASLPLELQQEIFSHLDSRSFYAARKVCRWWRLASFDSVTLARHLQKLPVKPPVNARETEPYELQRLFNEVARTLLLGVRIKEREDVAESLLSRRKSGLFARPRIAAVSRGSKTVTINGGWLALFDTAQDPPDVLLQRPLNDMFEGARQVPWLRIAPASSHALALSSDGGLLAGAQERTIHIYDLTAGADAGTAHRTVASAAGHYIAGLDFEQNDRMLRVQLSGKGIVLYLGTPAVPDKCAASNHMDYWKSTAGLRHTFLDSSLLQLAPSAQGAEHFQSRLGGLQLLRPLPSTSGFLFAAQKHGGNASSHYVYGHVRCSNPTEGLPLAVEPGSVTEIAKLESFLSAWEYMKDHFADGGMGGWEDMPSAHEHHPKFATSEGGDGNLLVVAEREKKHIRHVKWTQLFVFRIPSLRRTEEIVRAGEFGEQVRWKRLAQFLEGVEEPADGLVRVGSWGAGEGKAEHVVARVPLAVGTMEGEASEIVFERDDDDAAVHDLTVATEQRRRRWRLVET